MAVSSRLENRVAIVTGGSSGLGRAISLAYASHGAKLVVIADLQESRRPEGVETDEEPTHVAINRIYGAGRSVFVRTDVTDSPSVGNAVAEAVKLGGRLDIIVNNAGLGARSTSGRLHEFPDDEWDRVMNVNVKGVYHGCKHALAQFLKQDPTENGKRGWIINVASVLGYVGFRAGTGAYCTSKAAVINLSKQIAVDYARDQIHCNALCPGFTRTAMTRGGMANELFDQHIKNTHPLGGWGEAEQVAKGAVFLASDDASWVTGVGLPVDGGFLAL